MAFSSTDIASLTGGFNQQIMLQQQQAAMITQQFGGYSPNPYAHPVSTQGEQFSGMLMQGMGQMGMSALGSHRLNTMGHGIAAPAAQTGQFMMGQMMYGANQQQMLDSNLRSSYRFPNSFGGRGFTGTDTAMVGSSLRQMSHQRGPGGETASFEELGQLASNMGRMGMAEGVRSVKDFNEKFKQMLSTVKTIATELGTSLEEAQKVMASMKGSGVFKGQGQFASLIRKGALAGNISTAEMSSSALMGAQISRSVGGLGRSGAMAGIQTMSNVGSAVQSGVMSEEDIYNVTGLTGAEGRQAMSQNMMSGDAHFFSGGLGRRVLASIAGKNGKVNQNDVMAYLAGGVGTGETMSMAGKNLGKIGRANFIRNEGRLRGEAMSAFGGLGKAVVARSWLEGRGMDMNEMDDRSMLFFQRKFGVGRDEADQLIKMARNLDTIMAHRQKSAENDQYMKRIDQADRAGKPEEIVKRLEMARNEINDGLREVGAKFYKSMGSSIGEFIGKISGEYVQRRRAAMANVVNQMFHGGPGTSEMMARELGVTVGGDGKLSMARLSSSGIDAKEALFGYGKLSESQVSRFVGSHSNRYREAGYDITGSKSVADVNEIQQRAFQASSGFSMGGGTKVDAGTLDKFTSIAANQGLRGSGDTLMKSFESALGKVGTAESKALLKKFASADAKTRGAMMSDVMSQAGIRGEFSDRMSSPFGLSGIMGSKFATQDEENAAIGNYILGDRERLRSGMGVSDRISTLGKDASAILGGGTSTLGWMAGGVGEFAAGQGAHLDRWASATFGKDPGAEKRRGEMGIPEQALGHLARGADSLLGGSLGSAAGYGFDKVDKTALGEFLKGDEARNKLGAMSTAKGSQLDEMLSDTRKQRLSLASQKSLSSQDQVQLEGLRTMEAFGRVQKAGGDAASKESLKEIASQMGFKDVDALMKAYGGAQATLFTERRRDLAQAFEGVGQRAQEEISSTAESEKVIDEELKSGKIKVSKEALSYRDKMKEMRKVQAGMTGGTDQESLEKNLKLQDHVGQLDRETSFMRGKGSVADKRKRAREYMQLGMSDEGRRLMAEAKIEERLIKGSARGTEGTLEAMAGSLGVEYEKGTFKGLESGAGVRELMGRLGLGSGSKVKNKDEIEKELMSIVGNKKLSTAERSQSLRALQGRDELVQAKKQKAEADDPSLQKLSAVKESVDNVDKSVGRVANALNSGIKVLKEGASE